MPTFNSPSRIAEEAADGLRALAHATRSIEDPSEVYSVLGSLSMGLGSVEEVLHQLGVFHDHPARETAGAAGDRQSGRAASYQVAWELHRVAEMVHQVAAGVDRAHEVEATIIHPVREAPSTARRPRSASERGLSL